MTRPSARAPRRPPLARSRWRDFRGTLRPTGAVLVGVGLAQAACAAVGAAFAYGTGAPERAGPSDLVGLAAGAALTGAIGAMLYLYGRRHASESLGRREALLTVALIWLIAGAGGAIPFLVSGVLGPIDALFESVSGMTTTGATVIGDIDGELVKGTLGRPGGLSMPVLLWRSLIQWLGGMGIVVLFVAIFPTVGAGAKHMFKGEVPGTSAEGLKPRIAETSFTLWKIYGAFTAALAGLLVLLGMSPFDAVCHALTTLSTGGFSTSDNSIAGFDSFAIELVIATFMYVGSVNYALYYALLRRRSLRALVGNTELRAFVAMCALFVAALTASNLERHGGDVIESFRYAYFMVGTTMSSTGYGTDDYMAYSEPTLLLVVVMMFVGGCSGSTAGGIKVERVVLMAKMSWAELRAAFRPAVVHVIRMGRAAVAPEILRDVAVFVGVYLGCLGLGVLFVTATDGVTIGTAFGATLSCLSNMGPAPWYASADNFVAYSPAAKLFFVFAMLLGRLEFFTLLALLVPDFWRR
ncbi:MAG: TrkH family potassium uptake protein [Sandaracinaceae bacterium]|nr:TrkH family potassium uptake protein [Sandaracinaceae bacterium]